MSTFIHFKIYDIIHFPKALKARGYERLVLQVGRGSVLPGPESGLDLTLEAFRFKDSISEDIAGAHLVISHAGVYSDQGPCNHLAPLSH